MLFFQFCLDASRDECCREYEVDGTRFAMDYNSKSLIGESKQHISMPQCNLFVNNKNNRDQHQSELQQQMVVLDSFSQKNRSVAAR